MPNSTTKHGRLYARAKKMRSKFAAAMDDDTIGLGERYECVETTINEKIPAAIKDAASALALLVNYYGEVNGQGDPNFAPGQLVPSLEAITGVWDDHAETLAVVRSNRRIG